MRILITNDDGYDAPGLQILTQIAKKFSNDVWIVAPNVNYSASGRSLSIRERIYVTQHTEREFSISASPATCTLFAMHNILADKKPDVVLVGINRGANLGEDIGCSGTVGAAIEGSLMNIKSIALSQDVIEHSAPWEYVASHDLHKGVNWEICRFFTTAMLPILLKYDLPKYVCLTINFPNCALNEVQDIRFVKQGIRANELRRFVHHLDTKNQTYYTFGKRNHIPQNSQSHTDTDLYCNMHKIISILPVSAYQDIDFHTSHIKFDTKALLAKLRTVCKFG